MNKTWIQVNERNRPVCKANDFIKDKTARRGGRVRWMRCAYPPYRVGICGGEYWWP
jgi:hypothetical protein